MKTALRSILTSHHLKLPFGMGDTPLREIVRLVRDRNWRMPANIEMAYPTDDPVREVRESLGFLRAALAG